MKPWTNTRSWPQKPEYGYQSRDQAQLPLLSATGNTKIKLRSSYFGFACCNALKLRIDWSIQITVVHITRHFADTVCAQSEAELTAVGPWAVLPARAAVTARTEIHKINEGSKLICLVSVVCINIYYSHALCSVHSHFRSYSIFTFSFPTNLTLSCFVHRRKVCLQLPKIA